MARTRPFGTSKNPYMKKAKRPLSRKTKRARQQKVGKALRANPPKGFKFYGTYAYKKVAQEVAERIRKQGDYARVVPTKGTVWGARGTVWWVYFKRKKWASKKNPYKRTRIASPKEFAKKSFRTIPAGKRGSKLVVGCPAGKFKKGRCKVGMEVQTVLTKQNAVIKGMRYALMAEIKARGGFNRYVWYTATLTQARAGAESIYADFPGARARIQDLKTGKFKKTRTKKALAKNWSKKHHKEGAGFAGKLKKKAKGKQKAFWEGYESAHQDSIARPNPGQKWHRQERDKNRKWARKYLAVGDKQTFKFYAGKFSAHEDALRKGARKSKKNPLLMIVPNSGKYTVSWTASSGRTVTRKYKTEDGARRQVASLRLVKKRFKLTGPSGKVLDSTVLPPRPSKKNPRAKWVIEAYNVKTEEWVQQTFTTKKEADRVADHLSGSGFKAVEIRRVGTKRKKATRNPGNKAITELMKSAEGRKALKLFRKVHGCDPTSIERRMLPIGGKKVTGTEFFVTLGEAPADSYDTAKVKDSRKGDTIYVHSYEGKKPLKVVSADGKVILTMPGKHRVKSGMGSKEAWIHG